VKSGSDPNSGKSGSDPDFRGQVEALRPYLMRYASLQLRNREAAEDAVQETLLAALSAEASFEGRRGKAPWQALFEEKT